MATTNKSKRLEHTQISLQSLLWAWTNSLRGSKWRRKPVQGKLCLGGEEVPLPVKGTDGEGF